MLMGMKVSGEGRSSPAAEPAAPRAAVTAAHPFRRRCLRRSIPSQSLSWGWAGAELSPRTNKPCKCIIGGTREESKHICIYPERRCQYLRVPPLPFPAVTSTAKSQRGRSAPALPPPSGERLGLWQAASATGGTGMLFATVGCDSGRFSARGYTQQGQRPLQPAPAAPFPFHRWGKLRHKGTLPGLNTNCGRPTHVTAAKPTPGWLLPSRVLPSAARRAVPPLGAAPGAAVDTPAPCPPLSSAFPRGSARTLQREGTMLTHALWSTTLPARPKKPPVISFPSAAPHPSSRERSHHLPNTRGVVEIHSLGPPTPVHQCPMQQKKERPRPSWTGLDGGEETHTEVGHRRDGKEPTSRAGWAPSAPALMLCPSTSPSLNRGGGHPSPLCPGSKTRPLRRSANPPRVPSLLRHLLPAGT